MRAIQKINFLLDRLEKSDARANNLKKVERLFKDLKLNEKHADFQTLFDYSAMNLTAIGLKPDNFGTLQNGKYVQIIAIGEVFNEVGKKVNKNRSLGYYGKAEKLEEELKNKIIEFVLRWRYEKSFQHSDNYQQLLGKLY